MITQDEFMSRFINESFDYEVIFIIGALGWFYALAITMIQLGRYL